MEGTMANYRLIPEEVFSYFKISPDTGKIYTYKKDNQLKEVGAKNGRKKKSKIRVTFKTTTYLRSHLIWQMVNGKVPTGKQIFHKNGVLTDDRISNLYLDETQKATTHKTVTRNSTGLAYIVLRKNEYIISWPNKPININFKERSYKKLEEALWVRNNYVPKYYWKNRDRVSVKPIKPKNLNSTLCATGFKYIYNCSNGFMVKYTKNGKSVYCGFHTTINGAMDIRSKFISTHLWAGKDKKE